MILFLFACLSVHRVSKLSDYSSEIERENNAHKAIEYAIKKTIVQQQDKQAKAMQVIGRLRVADTKTITGSLSLLRNQGRSSPLYYQTVWAIGELGRELEWNKESQEIHQQLLQNLASSQNRLEAHYLLEAIGKIYCQHNHTLEEDINTTRVLQNYEANNEDVPGILYVLLEKIQSLPVLISLLNEQMENKGSESETYGAVLELMRFIHENQNQLVNNHDHYQQQIKDAFVNATALLTHEQKAITLMTVWTFSEVATDPVLAPYIVDTLIKLMESSDNATRQIITYTLAKMTSEEQTRHYFRETYLSQVNSPSELQILHYMQQHDLDLVQQIFGIPLENENAP